jgi:DNA polymerase-3 subunit beta
VLLDATAGALSLTGYDLNLGIQTKIPASVSTDGITAVPHRLMQDIVSKLPSDSPISLALEGERLTISSTTGSYELAASDPKDYPDFPAVKGDPVIFPSGVFSQAIRQVAFCASNDESKQVLMGVNISNAANTVKVACTDGHRLAVSSYEDSNGAGDDFNITIPAASILEATKLAVDDDISITTDNHSQLLIKTGDTLLTTRSFSAAYPRYEDLIPKSFQYIFTVDRKCFISAVSRVSTVVQAGTNAVKLSFNDNMLSITADDQQNKAHEKLPLQNEVSLEEFVVALNATYALSAVKAVSTDHINLYFNSPTTPMLIKPVDSDGQSTSQTYLIMPIQIRI